MNCKVVRGMPTTFKYHIDVDNKIIKQENIDAEQ